MSALDRVSTWLRGTRRGADLVREIEAAHQEAAALATEREKAAANLAAIRKRRKAEEPALAKAAEAAAAEIQRLRAAADAAIAIQREIEHKANATLVSFSYAEDAAVNALRLTASPVIDDFLAELRDAAADARSKAYSQAEGAGVKAAWRSNFEAINRRTAAIRAARTAVEQLQLELLSDADLAKRLQAIRDALPPLAELQVLSAV